MDLDARLRELIREWKRINREITRLEAQQPKETQQGRTNVRSIGRRGRRTMEPEERLEVSRRMREYWRARRERKKPEGGTDEPSE